MLFAAVRARRSDLKKDEDNETTPPVSVQITTNLVRIELIP